MNFALSKDQLELQASIRSFLEAQGYTRIGRRYMDGDRTAMVDVWDGMADLGYLGMMVPEKYGGTGLDFITVAAVLEEIGRAVVPGPVVETSVFAAVLINRCGTEDQKNEWLPQIATGKWRCGVCLYEPGADIDTLLPASMETTVSPTPDGWVLSGTKAGVWHGAEAERLLVVARPQEDGGSGDLAVLMVDPGMTGVTARERGSLDPTRSLADFTFNNVRLEKTALLGGGTVNRATLQNVFDITATALAAMMVGGMDRVVEMSVQHANTREQFGQPIGRFQAIKHRIVDMKVDLETGRSLAYYAAWALETGAADAAVAASSAKAFCSEAFVRTASHNVQNHGGMGFTWDHDAHLYLKRAKAWENYFGSPLDHRERIAVAFAW